jgi:hypothetical protein
VGRTEVPRIRTLRKNGTTAGGSSQEDAQAEVRAARGHPRELAKLSQSAAARELKDRWLERVNAGEYVFENAGKYDVARVLPHAPAALKQLPLAA